MPRLPAFLSRLRQVISGLREERSLPAPAQQLSSGCGVPHTYRPEATLDAYRGKLWLAGAVSRIASEIARTRFKIRTKGDEPEQVRRHQAIELLDKLQTIKGGKSMLTSFDLKYMTALHLLLPGECF